MLKVIIDIITFILWLIALGILMYANTRMFKFITELKDQLNNYEQRLDLMNSNYENLANGYETLLSQIWKYCKESNKDKEENHE